MQYILGAHLSAAGGYHKAIQSIVEKGGNALQIFSSSPRIWQDAKPPDETIEQFNNVRHQYGVSPVFFHARYLINLADTGRTGTMSVKTLIHELTLAKKMDIRGSIVHTGSFKGELKQLDYREHKSHESYQCLIRNIQSVLSNSPIETHIILENAGNRKIGQSIEQLACIVEDVNNDRVRICLDTCHLHAAGYDLRTKEDFEAFLDKFDRLIGLDKIALIHMNDSKDARGSLRDRHENLGKGFVGEEVFKNLINNARTKHLPFIIETPGFDDKGPDKANLDILKSYIL